MVDLQAKQMADDFARRIMQQGMSVEQYFQFTGLNEEKMMEELQKYKVPVVVTLNSFVTDSEAEIAFVKQFCEERGCEFAISEVWEKGGEGGIALAEKVLKTLEEKESHFEPLYPSEKRSTVQRV